MNQDFLQKVLITFWVKLKKDYKKLEKEIKRRQSQYEKGDPLRETELSLKFTQILQLTWRSRIM